MQCASRSILPYSIGFLIAVHSFTGVPFQAHISFTILKIGPHRGICSSPLKSKRYLPWTFLVVCISLHSTPCCATALSQRPGRPFRIFRSYLPVPSCAGKRRKP